jgi:hypothetical protein
MKQQMEFDWTWAERMGILHALQLPTVKLTEGRTTVGVSGAAMKAVLKTLNEYGNQSRNGEAFMGYDKLIASCGLSRRQTKRAIKALVTLSLITLDRRASNRYRLVWNELALRTGSTKCHDGTSPVVSDSAMVTTRSAMVTPDSAMVTTRSAIMAPKLLLTVQEETTTNSATAVVVVSLEGCGLQDAARTYSLAKAPPMVLTDEDILARIAIWRELPPDRRLPGTLNNWLTKRNSFDSWANSQRSNGEIKLKLQELTHDEDIRKRADLIKFGRDKGWSFQHLQAAVTDWESKRLQQRHEEENSCKPQPGKLETNQLVLVRTQRPLNQQF